MPDRGASAAGTYTDGRTARRHSVRATIGVDGLLIESGDGAVAEAWPFDDLRLVDEAYAGRPFRLKRSAGEARLTVADSAFLDRLRPHAGRLSRKDLRGANLKVRAAGWIGATAAVLAGFWFLLPLAAGPVASWVPLSWEEGLGRTVQRQALALMAANSRLCTGSSGQLAFARLVRRLSATKPSRYRFRVTVVDNGTVNAFAAPGGYIVVFRGLIDNSADADGLAGVMAHEMGHVIERHGMENLVKALGLSFVMSALIGDTSGFAGIATDMAQNLATSKFSRDAEREADRIAVEMLNRANISGRGFHAFFQMVVRETGQEDKSIGRYFASHPATRGRAQFVETHTTGTRPAMSDSEWQAVRRMCDR
ncbi:MAG: M48 family metallopeptidase [Rhodospirillaceae bacterium]|nr:M48 family metallopeptidase [Rhodospirillaceae bacterium]MYJ71683.1 M48 family metallopeptidase [Rhodospirillaceae bacterium]